MGVVQTIGSLLIVFMIISCAPTFAQSTSDPVTIDFIEDRIAAVRNNAALSDTQQREAIELLERARNHLASMAQRAADLKQFQTSAQSADQALANIADRRAELESAQEELREDIPVRELQARLSLLEAERRSLLESLSQLRAEGMSLNGRASVIADEVVAARADVNQLFEVLNADPDRPEVLAEEAQWLLTKASLLERQTAIVDLQEELETLPARQALVAARTTLAEAEIARKNETIKQLRARLSQSELGRAEIAIREAQADVVALEEAGAELWAIAKGNLERARKVEGSIRRRASLQRLILEAEREANALSQSTDTVKLVVGAGRLSDDTAALLNGMQGNLPDQADIKTLLFNSERQRGDIQLQLIVWLDELRASGISRQAPGELQDRGAESQSVSSALDTRQRLVDVRRDSLELLVEGARQESELMAEYQLVLGELSQRSSALSTILNRRLLWLRTSEPVNWSWLGQIPSAIAWVFSPSSWGRAVHALVSGAAANPIAASVVIAALLALIGLRRRLFETLESCADDVGHVGRDTYWATPIALAITLLLALPIPLAIGATGWLIHNGGVDPTAFTQGLTQTLQLLGPVLLVLYVFLEMCRPSGLFAKHFNWTEKARIRLCRNLHWFIRVEVIAILLFGLASFSSPPGVSYGIGVPALVAASIALALLTFQFLRPKGGIVSQLKTGPTTSLLLKLLLPVAVFEPLFVGALPFFGFFDTAIQLQFKVLQSGGLILAGAVLYGLAARIFMVGNRRFALRRALEKRARAEASRLSEAEMEASGETLGAEMDQSIADAEAISDQVRAVLKLAAIAFVSIMLWFLWSPLLPALGVAEDLSLWTRTITENGTVLRESVTLLDVVTAFLFLAAAVFVVRNTSGLLEITLFEPFGLDAPSRYAISSITRYIVVAIAIALSFTRLGANWSELQWIIAALGVGLGFGLQEIVANFVSGLIILFERPIRVGDVVTIGALRGTVQSIKIRSTTITDFDNCQVILPNKTIITENVTNWTLEDDVTRLLLRVGVTYGSDIEKVSALIFDTVTAHPDVLDKPPPTVFFMAHGDSALQFEVRLFVSKPAKRLPTTHALNTAINTTLKENGIHIPFPQTQVHISMEAAQALSAKDASPGDWTRVSEEQDSPNYAKSTTAP